MSDEQLTLDQNRASEILKARARVLARPIEQLQSADSLLKVVEFRLAQERYAVEQRYVREVWTLETLTPLPCVPAHILGIINMRGQILPVIDVRIFFELPACGITDLHTVIVAQVDDVELGILADMVTGAAEYPLDTLQPSLPTLTGIRAEYLRGVTSEQIVVLDVCKILRDPKLLVNEEVPS